MDIREFNQRFDHVSGPNKAGEYTMRCPCHDDKTASLTARVKPGTDGRLRIFLCCHAGCSNDSILAQVGLKPVDLIIDPEPPKAGGKWKGKAEKKKPAPAPKPTQDKGPEPPAEKAADKPKVDWAHPDAVYSYTDVNGKELFQVVRYPVYKDGKRDKTFRQRHYDPKDPKANRQGYVGSVSNTLRDNTLYKMPELAAAIREGRPVYVVEGEKDVETLLRLGHTATCNPGGAGKWRSSYSRLLAGADVIILPDNDTKENNYTGQNHALDVALKTKGIAKRVRLVDIKEACPDLPAKGDISDMVQIMGDQAAMEALARQVAATRDFDPGAVPFWLNPMEQANALYSRVPSYGVVDGCIAQITPDSTKALTDFVVIPRMELTRDDGVNTSMWFVLDGWDSNGHKLDRATISAKELDAMNWVTGKWGFRASLAPGTSTKDKVAWAIKQVGKMTAKRVTEYGHTGWRQIGGKWCYLYHGGAVGMEGVSVDMGVDKLKSYRLDGSGAKDFDKITYRDAIEYSMSIQYAMKEEIGVNFRQMCIDINGMEGRAPETVACILVGYAMMLDYFRNVGLFDADTAKGMLQDAHRLLTATSKQQARSMDDEKPTRIFLDSMVELIASNSVVMKDLTGTGNEKSGKKPGVDLVGYFDNDYYYLLPKVAFGCVSKLCREQSTEFPVSLKALYKHLRTDGILKLPPDVGDDTPTRTKRVDGKLLRVLWIPRNAMDGPKAETEQLKMSMNGFQEVNYPDNPF